MGRLKGKLVDIDEFIKENKQLNEEWVQVEGTTDYYVSNLGRVLSYKRSYPKFLSPRPTAKGYFRANIHGRDRSVHRLVITHFGNEPTDELKNLCEGTYNGVEINHIDGDKTNNSIYNLEWCSRQDNIVHSNELGLRSAPAGEKNPRATLTDEEVVEIRRIYSKSKSSTYTEFCRMESVTRGVSFDIIYNIIRNKTWTHLL